MIKPAARARLLWLLLALFCLRVLGQVLVALGHAPFLPPMEQWQSGLLPYPVLLLSQSVIIVLFAKAAADLTRQRGYFAVPSPRLGTALVVFGWIYLLAMVLRYPIHMVRHPEARWFGGTIPIFFHWVLASFILLVGYYHRNVVAPKSTP